MSDQPSRNTIAPTPGANQHPDGARLYRHQDGGIYRFHFISKHTDNLAELVNYEHIWPFEPGAMWSRPVAEWDSRFTPISAEDAADAGQQTDRATAQAAIAQAKAARRAAGK